MSPPEGNKVDRVCDAIRAKLELAGHNKYVQHLVFFFWQIFDLGTDLSRAGLAKDLAFNCYDLWFYSTLGAQLGFSLNYFRDFTLIPPFIKKIEKCLIVFALI